jgi:serine/threonine-protein kinase
VLLGPLAADEGARADFVRACWTANRFHHPRIARVLEQGTDARGAPVVLRAWAKGEPLSQVLARGKLELPVALGIASQVLDALEIAHAHGILHASISPSNVIVTARSVRVVDFGHHGDDRIAVARVGPFSAPERHSAPASPPSEAADIWSAGACLRFALGDGPLPADVEAVIELATAHDPHYRYESAYAMLGDVRRLLAGRRPKLRSSMAPIPSQSYAALQLAGEAALPVSSTATPVSTGSPPSSSTGMLPSSAELPPSSTGLPASSSEVDTARASLLSNAPASAQGEARPGEWRGNALLILAIAVLMGVASFVMVRERLSEPARHAPATSEPR